MLDKCAKGRANTPRGERAGQSKLTEDAVRDIRSLSARGVSQHELARLYRVSQVAIGYVVRRRTWAHVE